jgi:hypothetical protein
MIKKLTVHIAGVRVIFGVVGSGGDVVVYVRILIRIAIARTFFYTIGTEAVRSDFGLAGLTESTTDGAVTIKEKIKLVH